MQESQSKARHARPGRRRPNILAWRHMKSSNWSISESRSSLGAVGLVDLPLGNAHAQAHRVAADGDQFDVALLGGDRRPSAPPNSCERSIFSAARRFRRCRRWPGVLYSGNMIALFGTDAAARRDSPCLQLSWLSTRIRSAHRRRRRRTGRNRGTPCSSCSGCSRSPDTSGDSGFIILVDLAQRNRRAGIAASHRLSLAPISRRSPRRRRTGR